MNHAYTDGELDKCACSDCSTDRLFPISLPLLRPPCFLRHNNTEIRPNSNPTVASKHSSGRKSHMSLTVKSKTRND